MFIFCVCQEVPFNKKSYNESQIFFTYNLKNFLFYLLNCNLIIIVLGNYQNQGRIRKKELYKSCKLLQIPEANVQILNSSLLPDDPQLNWNQEVVADIILNFIETFAIDTVSVIFWKISLKAF